MSKGIKLFFGFVIVFMMIGIISSCGGQKAEQAAPTPAQEAAPEKATPAETPVATEAPKPAVQETTAPTTPAAAVATTGKPKIACEQPEFDFGERSNEEKVEHEFIIKNIGDAKLLIDKVRTTCGCTVAELEKKELEPGESTKVKAILTLRGRQGATTKSISVESNDPETPILTLTLKGVAIPPILVEPQVVNFGKITEDKPEDKSIEVKANRPNLTFNITNVDLSQLPGFKTEIETIEQGKAYKIKLSATEPIAPGTSFINKRMIIETDIVPQDESAKDPNFVNAYQKIQVPVQGRSIGAIEVSPEVITFRANNENPNEKNSQYIRINAGREKEFKITEVIPPTPDIKVEVTERQPSDYLLHVQDIPANSSMKDKEIIVKTTSKSVPEIKIPFRVIELPSSRFPRPEGMMKGIPGKPPVPPEHPMSPHRPPAAAPQPTQPPQPAAPEQAAPQPPQQPPQTAAPEQAAPQPPQQPPQTAAPAETQK